MFDMRLTTQQLCSVSGHPETFWNCVLEMFNSLGVAFCDYDSQIRKMKRIMPAFFTMANPIIDARLSELGNSKMTFQNRMKITWNLIAVFPFFNRAEMLDFLAIAKHDLDNASEEELVLLKGWRNRFSDYLSHQLTEADIFAVFTALSGTSDSPGKYL
jgi:hypothetical protein